MKVALYFGSFNPIHHGHLIIANEILQQENYHELWFVVSPQNPFKNENNLLNANHRFQLVQLAIEGESKLKASNVEFKLPKPSYTVNTLIYLKEKYPNHQFDIVLGSDGFQNISKWKNSDFIINNYRFLIYERPGFEINNEASADVKVIVGSQLYISSTYIRKLIRENKSIRYLVPDLVNEEIKARGYYVDSKKETKKQTN
jgi:nicotinate-nucleotide adenylyltransferase